MTHRFLAPARGGLASTGAIATLSGSVGSGTTHPPANTTLDPPEATVNREVWRYGDADVIEQTAFLNAELPLGGAGAPVPYAFGGYGRSEASSNASFRRSGDNNSVHAIYPLGFLPFIDTDGTNASFAAGVRGRSATWDWDLSQSVGANTLEYFTDNTLNATYGAASPTRFYNGRVDFAQAITHLDLKTARDLAFGAGLALRGSASTGFHAPALQQQYFGSTSSRTDPNTNTIILARLFPVGDPAARALGARELDPEETVNLTAGATFERGAFTATADLYQIEIDDRIFLSSQFIGTAVQNYLTAIGLPGIEGARYFSNAADTRTRGLDLTARYPLTLAKAHRLTVTAGYNHNNTKLTRVRATPASVTALGITVPIFDLTERIRVTRGQPRDNAQLSLGWDFGRFTALVRGVRYGEHEAVALTNLAPAQVALFPTGSRFRTQTTETVGTAAGNVDVIGTFGARLLTDLDLGYRATDRLTVSIGANNAFNLTPPEVIRSNPQRLGADAGGVFRYSELSPFTYSGAFYYARVAVRF